jgi:hypothetical protein
VSAELDAWIQATGRARGRRGQPFAPGLVSEACHDRVGVIRGAVESLVAFVGDRPVIVSHDPGLSYTDFREMLVNLDGSVLEKDPESLDKLELLIGIAAHEAGHVFDTEPPPGNAARLFLWLYNVIEDERVEREVARRFPPLTHPLERARRELVRRVPFNIGPLEAIFLLVRAPKRLSRVEWVAHEALLLDVLRILEPFPSDSRQVRYAVRRILDRLPESFRKFKVPPWVHFCSRGTRRDRGGAEGERGRGRGRGSEFRWQGGPGEVGTRPPVEWTDAAPDAGRYAQFRSLVAGEAAQLAAKLDGLIPPTPRSHAVQGRLDRRRLHASQTDGRIFRGPGSRPDRIVLALIVVLSASMKGDSAELAQRIAILLSETCAALPGAPLYAYGHNADCGQAPLTRITRYGTPVLGPAHALGSITFGGSNRDAHALEVIGEDLLARVGPRRAPRLAVYISDAKPNAHEFKGDAAVRATRRAIDWLEQAWGPTLYVATDYSPVQRSLAGGPYMSFDSHHPGEGLGRLMEWCLRNR